MERALLGADEEGLRLDPSEEVWLISASREITHSYGDWHGTSPIRSQS